LLLSVKNATVLYEKVAAIRDITLGVAEGEIVTLIGANGAGKTTTLRAISGLVRPADGEIWFEDTRIDRMQPERINAMGIAHVPEGRRVFPYMSVMENLEMGAFARADGPAVKRDLDMVFGHFPVLRERMQQQAGTLSGGQQQMLAMGRALMAGPKIILMDEPSLGLSPIMCQDLAHHVPGDRQDHSGIARGRAHNRSRRAKRASGAVARAARLCARDGTGRAHRRRRRPQGERAGPQDLPRSCLTGPAARIGLRE
jgi:branched-chain amino acid transport system ATP-binding protein